MAFSDFQMPGVLTTFGLTYDVVSDLFAAVPDVPAGQFLERTLAKNATVALNLDNEKARSEWLIAPILGDFWLRYGGRISLHSGASFDADPEAGLNGYCDFLLGRAAQQLAVQAPVAVIVEAKRETVHNGLGQCIAGMVGALRFNQRHGTPTDTVFGAVTSGDYWKFLRLRDRDVHADLDEYHFTKTDRILGILAHMIGRPPTVTAAA